MRENIGLEFMTYEPSASGHSIMLPLFKTICSFGCVKNLKDSAEHFFFTSRKVTQVLLHIRIFVCQ